MTAARPSEQPEPITAEYGRTSTRDKLMRSLPWLWLALTVVWAAAVFLTELPAWTPAIWIAVTIGPVTALRSRAQPTSS